MQALLRPAAGFDVRRYLLPFPSASSSPSPTRPSFIASAPIAATGNLITLCRHSDRLFLQYNSYSSPNLQSPSLKRSVARSTAKPTAASVVPPPLDDSESAKLAQVSMRLESISLYFKRLGSLGFWSQLVCTLVAAAILSFSIIAAGKITSPATFYATAGGIAAAFISVFRSFGYIRLSERLHKTANEPTKAPPRADVVKYLKTGIVLNLLGIGAAIFGLLATNGLLVAKALATPAVPYYQGISPGRSPVLALDVFSVQASANTILSHFLGLVFSLELLRSVTLPHLEAAPLPKAV